MDSPKVAGSAATNAWEHRKRRVRVYKKRMTLKWFLAILAVALVVSMLLVAFGGLFESLEDQSYRPKDIERRYHELYKMKEAVEKGQLPARNGR
jgi:hypothetical protein